MITNTRIATSAIVVGLVFAGLIVTRWVGSDAVEMFRSWAQRPRSVGNKAAPLPVLEVIEIQTTYNRDLSRTQAQRSVSSFLGRRGVSATYSLKEYTMDWKMSVDDGSLVPVAASVFVPQGRSDQTFPVIVYGAGSTGLDDRCAPSREDLRDGNMGNYRNQMIAQASQGYVVIMPNYEGLDNPDRSQNYFNKDSEARTLLSAAKALLSVAESQGIPVQPNALFLAGYSQGGHAVFAAADYARTYVPDITINGVIGHGPTTDIVELLKSNPNLAAYFVKAYSDYYPVMNPEIILEPAWVKKLDSAQTLCVNEAFAANSTSVGAVFADPFERSLVNNTLAFEFPEISAVLEENDTGTSYTGIPTMIVQGTADPIVTNAAQQTFIDQLCKRQVPVELKIYKGVHHFTTRQDSFKDTNAWINNIAAGGAMPGNCGSLRL